MIFDFILGGLLSLVTYFLSFLTVTTLPVFLQNNIFGTSLYFASVFPFVGDIFAVILFCGTIISGYFVIWSVFKVYSMIIK